MKRLLLLLCLLCSLSARSQTYFPPLTGNTWDTLSPSALGWCEDSIQQLYNWLELSDTKAFILLKDGKIVLEKYFGTFTEDSVHVWNSAGKTLTAYTVGIAQQEGYLDIQDYTSDYLGNGWTSMTTAEEDSIRIWHQLTMTSGMDDGVSDPFCTDPACMTYLADPGTRWAYHNAPYTLLDSVIHVATSVPLNTYVYQKIGSKIGMIGLYVTIDYNHVFVSKPRSMARFGLLLSQNGVWNGTTVCSDLNYLNTMRNTSQNLNESYGYLTWLNGKNSFMIPQSQFVFNGSLMPDAPADVYAAEGKNGQIINVAPSDGIVLIRMGETLGNNLIATTYNDTIWQYINRFGCTLSVSDQSLTDLQLAPNPGQGHFSLNGLPSDAILEIHDLQGRTVDYTRQNEQITLTTPVKGVYFIKINIKNLTTTCKYLLE